MLVKLDLFDLTKVNIIHINSLPNHKFLDWSILIAFADDIINVTKRLKFGNSEGKKTMWEKEKMLLTSIFSFSHNVFKGFLFQGS